MQAIVHLLPLVLAAVAPNHIVQGTVERWKQWELSLKGPNTGNPFLEVDLGATFTLQQNHFDSKSTAPPPTPLVALDFSNGGDKMHAPNTGKSKNLYPAAELISAQRSGDVPAGREGAKSLDFGTDVEQRHAAELPGPGQVVGLVLGLGVGLGLGLGSNMLYMLVAHFVTRFSQ